MAFDHEKLDVYQVSLDFLVSANDLVELLPKGHGYIVNQLRRASLSIVGCGRGRVHVHGFWRIYQKRREILARYFNTTRYPAIT